MQLRALPLVLMLVGTLGHLFVEGLVVAFFGYRFKKRVREGLEMKKNFDKYRKVRD